MVNLFVVFHKTEQIRANGSCSPNFYHQICVVFPSSINQIQLWQKDKILHGSCDEWCGDLSKIQIKERKQRPRKDYSNLEGNAGQKETGSCKNTHLVKIWRGKWLVNLNNWCKKIRNYMFLCWCLWMWAQFNPITVPNTPNTQTVCTSISYWSTCGLMWTPVTAVNYCRLKKREPASLYFITSL